MLLRRFPAPLTSRVGSCFWKPQLSPGPIPQRDRLSRVLQDPRLRLLRVESIVHRTCLGEFSLYPQHLRPTFSACQPRSSRSLRLFSPRYPSEGEIDLVALGAYSEDFQN